VNSRVPNITHKAYFPIALTSNPTNLVCLMVYLGNVNLQCNNDIQVTSWVCLER
jgi:hypothetical protein